MSSITLNSQSLPSARPLANGSAARALVDAIASCAALLRDTTASHLRARRQVAEANALRERALTHLAVNPSFAADLLAAASQLQNTVEQA